MATNTPDDLGTVEYQAAMQRVVLAAQCIEDEPFAKMLATIERAHSLGPIQYPTEYRDALSRGSLDAQQSMLEAARDFVLTLNKVEHACTNHTQKD